MQNNQLFDFKINNQDLLSILNNNTNNNQIKKPSNFEGFFLLPIFYKIFEFNRRLDNRVVLFNIILIIGIN